MYASRLQARRSPVIRASFSRADIAPVLASVLVFAAASHHFILSLVNANLFQISNGHLMAVDALIVLCALALAGLLKPVIVCVGASFIALNFFVLGALSGGLDLKAFRDLLIPLAFFSLGLALAGHRWARLAFWSTALAVVAAGLLELLLSDAFLQLVNPQAFFVARGLIDPASTEHLGQFSIENGQRFGERNFASFLGNQRLGSIFIEPVTLGNFGALAVIYAICSGRLGNRAEALGAAAVALLAIIGSDGRFAMMASLGLIGLALAPRTLLRAALPLLPLMFIGALVTLAWTHHGIVEDTLQGRLTHSGELLSGLSLKEAFGLGRTASADDAGYYYALTTFGVLACTAIWATLCLIPADRPVGTYAKAGAALLAAALLCISGTSLFALKFGALFWFILGTFCSRPATAESAPLGAIDLRGWGRAGPGPGTFAGQTGRLRPLS